MKFKASLFEIKAFRKSGGGNWIRTSVGIANGFTVRPF